MTNIIVFCGGEDFEVFVSKAANNASYNSTDAVTDLVEAIGVWGDQFQVNELRNAPFSALWLMSMSM